MSFCDIALDGRSFDRIDVDDPQLVAGLDVPSDLPLSDGLYVDENTAKTVADMQPVPGKLYFTRG